jgi:hypothetical protein
LLWCSKREITGFLAEAGDEASKLTEIAALQSFVFLRLGENRSQVVET